MIKENKELQKAIHTLYDNLKEEDYGKKFSWEKLMELSGLSKKDKEKIYYVGNKVCLLLMSNDMKYLETVKNYGKRIVNPNEHEVIAKKTANKSVKIYKKAGAVLASTNMDELTEEQKSSIIEQANKYSTLEMFTNEMLKKKKIGVSGKSDIRTASLFLDAIKMFSKE